MKTTAPAPHPATCRGWLGRLLALGAAATAAQTPARAASGPAAPATCGQSDAPHKIVYQLNQADEAYQEAIFNSISALLKKYVGAAAVMELQEKGYKYLAW